MERALEDYYYKNNISREPLVPRMGELALGLDTMNFAVPQENYRLFKTEQELNRRIFGQSDAIKSIMAVLSRGEFRDPKRPRANLLFVGPTGVGKTETALELSSVINESNNDRAFLKIDCSQYSNGHEVTRLYGSPPSYKGFDQPALFTRFDDTRPNVLLFDELEKGSSELYDLMLQILDDGSLEMMNEDRTVSFRESIIIATSNVGAREISRLAEGRSVGFIDHAAPKERVSKKRLGRAALDGLKQRFQPEFLGRWNDIITFDSFDDEQLGEVLDRYVDKLNESDQYTSVGVHLTLSTELRDKIVAESEERNVFGARPVLNHFNRTVGKDFGSMMSSRSIPWHSSVYAVPAESVPVEQRSTDFPDMTTAFFYDNAEEGARRMAQEEDDEFYRQLEKNRFGSRYDEPLRDFERKVKKR